MYHMLTVIVRLDCYITLFFILDTAMSIIFAMPYDLTKVIFFNF